MNSISTKNSVVYFNSETYTELNKYIQNQNPSKIFILVDTNTHEYCLPQFLERLESNNITVEVMEIRDRPYTGKDLRPIISIVDTNGAPQMIPGTDSPAEYMLPEKALALR